MPGLPGEVESGGGDDSAGAVTRTLTPLERLPSYQKAIEEGTGIRKKGTGEHQTEDEDEGLVDGKKKKKKKKKPEMVSVGELFRYATGLDKLLIFIGICAGLMHGVALPAVILVLGEVLDEFIKQSNFTLEYVNDTAGLEAANEAFEGRISNMAWAFGGLAMVTFIVGYIQTSTWFYSGIRQVHAIRRNFFRAIIYQEMGWFDTHNTGELVSRLSGDVIKVQQGLGEKNGLLVQWISSAITGLVMGFVKGPLLAVVILACTPLLAISAAMMSKLLSSYQNKEQTAYAKAGSIAEEVLASIRTVVAFGGEDREVERYTEQLEHARQLGVRKGVVVGLGTGFVFVTLFSTYGLAFWWGSQLILRGDISGGDMLTTFFAVLIGGFSLGHAAQNAEGSSTGRGAAVAIYKIINRASEIDASTTRGKQLPKVTGDISLVNVGFTYPSRPDTKILTRLNLTIPSGKTVAIVGASGCGKSTVIQLIQRMYDPDHGEVQLDGEDIRDCNIAWLRSQIGVVSQEPVLFATTIKENIAYGSDKADVSQEEIEAAAKAANAHSFILDLPEKYDTLVGERGSQLSGGQKQRVAIARALIRNPKILLLDEATSALDTESEGIVQDALDQARQGRTTIVIAHRLSTVRNADLIVSIDSGEVSEKGTHDDLMKAKGIYYTLVTMQTFLTEAQPETLEDAELALGSLVGEVKSADFSSPVRQISLQSEAAKFNRQYSRQPSTGGKDESFTKPSAIKQVSLVDEDDEEVKKPEEEPEEDDEFKDAKGPFGRLLKDSLVEWWALLLGLIGAVGNGAVMPVFAILFSKMLEIFSLPRDEFETQSKFWSAMFPVLGVSAGILMLMNLYFFTYAGEGLTKRMRRRVFRSFLHRNMEFFDDPKHSTGSLTVRLSRDAALMQQAGGRTMGQALGAVTTLVAALIISFISNVYLTLVILGLVPVIVLSGYLQMKTLAGHEHSNKDRLQDAGKIAVETIENIRTVTAFGLEKRRYENYMTKINAVHIKEKREAHVYGLMTGFGVATIFTIYAVSFRFGGYLIAHHGVAYGEVFRTFSALVFSAMSLGQGTAFAGEAGKGGPAAARIYALLDEDSGFYETTEDLEKPDDCTGTIELQDVDFTYPSRPERQVLNKLSFSAQEGQTVALVGTSGCGKSTSVSLLERFYDVQSGVVRVSGHDVTKLNVRWLRQQMGIVQQEPVLFDSSIADNIAYGALFRDMISQEEIEAVAKKANIHSFIVTLPQGYETNVGAKGTQLSGGQKQRVAIARALIRNPKILLLDEATSALDTESEKVVQTALDEARIGRTCVTIAHRLSTIQNADCIYVLGNGEVLEHGTHAELLEKETGAYYNLNKAQITNRRIN